jgi:hypothetical protein
MNATRFAFAVAGALAVAAPVSAQSDWNWNKPMAAGQTLQIKGINGGIKAIAVPGGEARVVAVKTAKKSDVDDVRIVVVESRGVTTICALYPNKRGRDENTCSQNGGQSVDNNDVQVEFTVQVPRGVKLDAESVNGGIEATGLTGDVRAETVNGSIRLATSGLASAESVNGSINVTMGRADWAGDLKFETVNGGITVSFPTDVNADVVASTVNGDIETDFDLTVSGRFGPKRLSGKIGTGGRKLYLDTVNGAIAIKRR